MTATAAVLNIWFDFIILNRKANWLRTSLAVSRWLVDKKVKYVPIGNPRITYGRHLDGLYWMASLESRGQLIKNLTGNQMSDTQGHLGPIVIICWVVGKGHFAICSYAKIRRDQARPGHPCSLTKVLSVSDIFYFIEAKVVIRLYVCAANLCLLGCICDKACHHENMPI